MAHQPDKFAIEATDWRGRTVRMTWQTYNAHKRKHLEVPEYVEEIKILIGDPDIVYIDDNSQCIHMYRLGLGREKYSKLYLWAGVYYRSNDIGSLASYYFTSRMRTDLRLIERRFIVMSNSGQRIVVGKGGLE